MATRSTITIIALASALAACDGPGLTRDWRGAFDGRARATAADTPRWEWVEASIASGVELAVEDIDGEYLVEVMVDFSEVEPSKTRQLLEETCGASMSARGLLGDDVLHGPVAASIEDDGELERLVMAGFLQLRYGTCEVEGSFRATSAYR